MSNVYTGYSIHKIDCPVIKLPQYFGRKFLKLIAEIELSPFCIALIRKVVNEV
jgi:hypothetical protein